VDEALTAARRSLEMPAEDVRSGVLAQRAYAEALAASGDRDAAREAAQRAVDLAYATELVSERSAADALAASLA
jgi:hypothetical protein